MTSKTCLPPCSPNVAGPLPGVTPPQATSAPPATTTKKAEVCAGLVDVTVDVTSQQVALLPGTVVYTKKCPTELEFDTSILCDPTTGARILVVTRYSDTGVPTSTAYNIDGTAYAGAVSDLVACDTNSESDAEEMCDDNNGSPVAFLRWFVKKNGEPTGVSFDTDMAGAAYTPVGTVTRGACGQTEGWYVELGCLSSPPKLDLSNVEKCHVVEIHILGVKYDVDLAEGWSPIEFANAINAHVAGFASVDGAVLTINATPPRAVVPVEIVCARVDFTEDFGVGGRTTSPNTNYAYHPPGAGPMHDGFYAVTNFGDPGLVSHNTANGTMTTDQSGNPNGRALFVCADAAPGEFYRQIATNLEIDAVYRVQFYVASTTVAAAPVPANVAIDILSPTGVVRRTTSTGNITVKGVWFKYNVDFVAQDVSATFVLRNNGAGGTGNDLAIDTITFAKVMRRLIPAGPRDEVIPVEVVKLLDRNGAVDSIRVFSEDGTTEYTSPYPRGLVLSVGDCPDIGSALGYGVVYSAPYPVCV